jgi:protein SCO1/2
VNSSNRTFPWTIIIGLLLTVFTVALLLVASQLKSRPARSPALPVLGKVNDFSLTNQSGSTVSLANLHGHVWIADIIFTRCPGPCLRMTRQMKEIEQALKPNSGVKLISLTTDPDFDTPTVLEKYAERFSVDTNRWSFLTGTKAQIADAAIGSLKLTAVEKAPADRESVDDLFIHSTIFVIVDKHGQLRGIFETGGEDVDWPQSKQAILSAAKELEKER